MDNQNRREYFRVSFADTVAEMHILEVGQRPITTFPRAVRLLNVSGGGLLMESDDDLPIRRGVIAQFSFTVGGQPFSFRGTFLRKLDDREVYRYGVMYIDVDEYQRAVLLSTLSRVQLEMSRAGG